MLLNLDIDNPQYFAIDSWLQFREMSTTGSRDKGVYISPDNEIYYFKTSIKKGKKDYPFEFWSEIAASLLGNLLGLPVLKYDIASRKDKIGCISKAMFQRNEEEFIEGVKLIIENEPNFKDYCKNNHFLYKIESALNSVRLPEFKRIAVEMVLFDCIIGNSDRHSENWALIKNKIGQSIYAWVEQLNILQRFQFYWTFHKRFNIPLHKVPHILDMTRYRFAPFYDNGSSLGRELSEERIVKMLNEPDAFDIYFSGGTSDIIVDDKKKSFLETIDALILHYQNECAHFVKNHLTKYNKEAFESLIYNMDALYPNNRFESSRISNNRKAFIIKLIDARINYIYQSIENLNNQVKPYGSQI